jgi:hypothetical protein
VIATLFWFILLPQQNTSAIIPIPAKTTTSIRLGIAFSPGDIEAGVSEKNLKKCPM